MIGSRHIETLRRQLHQKGRDSQPAHEEESNLSISKQELEEEKAQREEAAATSQADLELLGKRHDELEEEVSALRREREQTTAVSLDLKTQEKVLRRDLATSRAEEESLRRQLAVVKDDERSARAKADHATRQLDRQRAVGDPEVVRELQVSWEALQR